MAQQSEEDVILTIENIFKRVALDNILRYYKKYGNIIKTHNKSIVIWLQDEVEEPKLQVLNNICFDQITHIIVAKNKNVEKYELFAKEVDRKFAHRVSRIIKFNTKYSSLDMRDIVFVMIFMFYALRFNEPTIDIFNFVFLKNYLVNYNESKNLLFDVVHGTIMVNEKDLSSILRTYIMGMKYYPGYQKEYNCSLCEWFSNFLKFFCLDD